MFFRFVFAIPIQVIVEEVLIRAYEERAASAGRSRIRRFEISFGVNLNAILSP